MNNEKTEQIFGGGVQLLTISELPESASEIRSRLIEGNAFKSKLQANFVMAKNIFICCFDGKWLYLTDTNLNPLLAYKSSSFIAACGISTTGKYMVCQTAYNKENDEDSGATILFDTKERRVLQRRKVEIGVNDTRLIFVDEQKRRVFVYIADRILGEGNNIVVELDFDLQPSEKTLREYYKKPDLSPYVLNGRVLSLISKARNGAFGEVENEITELLNRIDESGKMSAYQLSTTYKELGDFYSDFGNTERAIGAYEKGLLLNPKLPIKKKLNSLKTK